MNDEPEEVKAGESTPPENNPLEMARIASGKDFISKIEAEEDSPVAQWQTSKGPVGIRIIGGDEMGEIFTAIYRRANDGSGEFDQLKTTDQIFLLTIHYGVCNERREPLFTLPELSKMFKGSKKSRYTEFLNECWDGVLAENYWLDPKNQTSLRRMVRMLFG